MTKRLHLHPRAIIYPLIILSLTSCASQTNIDKYASEGCDTLRALQASYDNDTAINAAPPINGVNAIDIRRNQERAIRDSRKTYKNLNKTAAANIDSIQAAYRKNNCSHKIDR